MSMVAWGVLSLTLGAAALPVSADQSASRRDGRSRLHFEPNRGQTAAQVRFLARGEGYRLYLTPTETVLALRGRNGKTDVVRLQLVSANADPELVGRAELPGRSHYFIGKDRAKWLSEVPHYARVEYRDVYQGINLIHYGNEGLLEHDFVVSPGADARWIRLGLEGVKKLRLDADGNLVVATRSGELVLRAPVVYQELQGRRESVSGRYVLRGKREVGFEIGPYDEQRPLVIDPVIVYSTYLGGSSINNVGGDGEVSDVAVDSAGNLYVTGWDRSGRLPTKNPFQSNNRGCYDAFVAKFDAGGNLVYATYLGGTSKSPCGLDGDLAYSIAVDASGSAVVTGRTDSIDFPTMVALQPNHGGGSSDAFVAKLSPSGSSLMFSTYLGGAAADVGYGVALDPQGNAYVAGSTSSSDFPTAQPFQAAVGGGQDAFVAELSASGSSLLFATYLGASGNDSARDIALDGDRNVLVTGDTDSTAFPVVNPVKTNPNGSDDAFVTKLAASGSGLLYSTYLGGSAEDHGAGIAVDSSGGAYVAGTTQSSDLPAINGFQNARGGGLDAFVVKLSATGSVAYSTYLGGSAEDRGFAIAVDASGSAYVTGLTFSTDFPLQGAVQDDISCAYSCGFVGADAFVARIAASGSTVVQSTYLGGSMVDSGKALALDPQQNVYVGGATNSGDWPGVSNALSTPPLVYQGGFVAKLGEGGPSLSVGDVSVKEGDEGSTQAVFTISLSAPAPHPVTLFYATADATAVECCIAGDYASVSGSLTFAPGVTSQTIAVPVIGDTRAELDEQFHLRIREVRGATVARALGKCTIGDDDQASIRIDDRTVAEGAAVNAAFRVRLSQALSQTVTVAYATEDGSARSPSDYGSVSGTLTFSPGRTVSSVFIPIVTDAVVEGDETFTVRLTNPMNAVFVRSQATGTITDPPPAAKVPMYRSYNRSTDYHFFTTDLASKNFAVGTLGFQDESNPIPFYVWSVQQSGTTALFRMYNPNLGRHFYTASSGSRDFIMSIGGVYEREEGFVFPLSTSPVPAGATELYLLYNNNSGTHLFTADASQKNAILSMFPGVWVQHTSVGYVFTSP